MACALKLRRFLQTEDGAVTVDWVVLTAAVMMIGAVSGFIVSSAVRRFFGSSSRSFFTRLFASGDTASHHGLGKS